MRLGMAAVSVHHYGLCKQRRGTPQFVACTVSRGRVQRGSGSATLDVKVIRFYIFKVKYNAVRL